MALDSAHGNKDRVSKRGRYFLRNRGNSWRTFGRFAFGKVHEGDDTAQFYFRVWLPKEEDGLQRICRANPSDLPALLHQDRIDNRKSVWFWAAQLIHYGLYDTTVIDDVRRKMARRCRRILRKQLRNGGLTVPAEIRSLEEDYRINAAAKDTHTGTKQASAEHANGMATTPSELVDDTNRDESEDDEILHEVMDHPSTICGLPARTQDHDHGDTSSADDQIPTYRLRSEFTEETDTYDEYEDNESTPGSKPDFRKDGVFSNAELRVLHDWRDRFCIQYNMNRADFQTMMKRSHALGNTRWTYDDFMTKSEFLEIFVKQLPKRKRMSMLSFRRHYDFNPPDEPELMRPPRTPTSAQRRRRSRLSMIDGDDDEGIDTAEAEVLNARAARDDTEIWELRATEALSDDGSDVSDIHFEEEHPHGSTLRVSHESTSSSYSTTPVPARKSYVRGEHDREEEDMDSDVNMTDVSGDFDTTNESPRRKGSCSKAISGDRTGRSKVRTSPVRPQASGSASAKTVRGIGQTTSIPHRAKSRTGLVVANSGIQRHGNEARQVFPTVQETFASVEDLGENSRVNASSAKEVYQSIEDESSWEGSSRDSSKRRLTLLTSGSTSSNLSWPDDVSTSRRCSSSLPASRFEHGCADSTHFSQGSYSNPRHFERNLEATDSTTERTDRRMNIPNETRDSSVSAALQKTQYNGITANFQRLNELEDAISILSIPSSPPRSRLLGKMPERSLPDHPMEVPQSPTRSILRNELSPRRPRSPRPQVEEFMNTHRNLPILLARTPRQPNPLQAIKRIAGSYGVIFTHLSQIEQEEQLDDFVAYLSKYIQKPCQENPSREVKNGERDAADHLIQETLVETGGISRKRQRSLEDDNEKTPQNENVHLASRSGVEGQKRCEPVRTKQRKLKRRRSGSGDPNGEIDVSDDRPNTSVVPVSTIRASSLQTPRLNILRGIPRSASYPSTPSSSQSGTPHERAKKQQVVRPELKAQHRQPEREASFEFPSPAFHTGLPISGAENDQDRNSEGKAMKRLAFAASEMDRKKPYGSQENPQIIPATPRTARTTTLEIKDEPRDDLVPPPMLARLQDESKGTTAEKPKKCRHNFQKAITPGPVRSSSTFGNPTPPSVINQGTQQLANLRLGQSFTRLPSLAEAMRQDDRLFRKNKPKAVNNPTRNPIIQAQIANTQLDDHNLRTFDTENNESQDGSRIKRPRNDVLSRQPQKYPSLFVQEQSNADVWHQGAPRSLGGSASEQKGQDTTSGSTSTKGGYNLGIPGVWRNRRSN